MDKLVPSHIVQQVNDLLAPYGVKLIGPNLDNNDLGPDGSTMIENDQEFHVVGYALRLWE